MVVAGLEPASELMVTLTLASASSVVLSTPVVPLWSTGGWRVPVASTPPCLIQFPLVLVGIVGGFATFRRDGCQNRFSGIVWSWRDKTHCLFPISDHSVSLDADECNDFARERCTFVLENVCGDFAFVVINF